MEFKNDRPFSKHVLAAIMMHEISLPEDEDDCLVQYRLSSAIQEEFPRCTLLEFTQWLYKSGYKAFEDVVSGSSSGCDSSGFSARPGWDVVSGFGTPYFPYILDLVLK